MLEILYELLSVFRGILSVAPVQKFAASTQTTSTHYVVEGRNICVSSILSSPAHRVNRIILYSLAPRIAVQRE
jgi:hypothetical protein